MEINDSIISMPNTNQIKEIELDATTYMRDAGVQVSPSRNFTREGFYTSTSSFPL